MSRHFLTPVNMNGNEILNLNLQSLATAPSPVTSRIYYDTTLNAVRYHNGTRWVTLEDAIDDQDVMQILSDNLFTGAGLSLSQPVQGGPITLSVTAGGIGTSLLANSAVTSEKLATDSVTSTKIASNAVGTDALQIEAVQDIVGALIEGGLPVTVVYDDANNKITIGLQALGIQSSHIAANAITASELASGAVSNIHVASNAAISLDKLAESSTKKLFTSGERTKLSGIATGATANASDAQLRDRSTHTGTQSHATISDFDSGVRTNRIDQMASAGGDVHLNGHKLTSVGTPTSDQDAANKAYVDAAISGLSILQPVRVIARVNISLASALPSIDGVSLTPGDRVLLTAQSTASENGVYVVSPAAALAHSDGEGDQPGSFIFVTEGSTNADTGWVNAADMSQGSPGPQNWTIFSRQAEIIAGAGLNRSGNTFSILSGLGLSINNGSLVIDTNVVVRKYASNVPASTAPTFTHNLGTRDVTVAVYRNTTPYDQVEVDVELISTTQVRLRFASTPTANEYRVVVHG